MPIQKLKKQLKIKKKTKSKIHKKYIKIDTFDIF